MKGSLSELCKQHGVTVKDVADYTGMKDPKNLYNWMESKPELLKAVILYTSMKKIKVNGLLD